MGLLLACGIALSGLTMMVSRRLGAQLLTGVVIVAVAASLLPPAAAGLAHRAGDSGLASALALVALLLGVLALRPVLRGLAPWVAGAVRARANRKATLARLRRSRRARIDAPIPLGELETEARAPASGDTTEHIDTSSRWLS